VNRLGLPGRGGLAVAALAFLSAWPTDEAPVGAARRVRVSVVVILASEREDAVDNKLKCIGDEVRKMHPKLTGFRMAKVFYRSLPVGARSTFRLPGGEVAEVAVERGADGKGRVRLKVSPPRMGEIAYSTPCGKFLPIITPVRTKKNELLILAIRVQPCPGR
jgi:hypothetical protein